MNDAIQLTPCDGECVRPSTTHFRQDWRYPHPSFRFFPIVLLHDGDRCPHGTELGQTTIRGEVLS